MSAISVDLHVIDQACGRTAGTQPAEFLLEEIAKRFGFLLGKGVAFHRSVIEIHAAVAFLESVPDRSRARAAADRLGRLVREHRLATPSPKIVFIRNIAVSANDRSW